MSNIPTNDENTPLEEIQRQLNELRPLPMGVQEFEDWSDRIISGAMVPTVNRDSLKKILAEMILRLGHMEDHKADAYFIHAMRKAAANEVAFAHLKKVDDEKKAAIEAEKKAQEAAANVSEAG